MMNRDETQLSLFSVTDTCAVWNILSSDCLYTAVLEARIKLTITPFILYECLYKVRQVSNPKDDRLKERLIRERAQGNFKEMKTVSIDDLQQLDIIQNRKRLSKGELTGIAAVRQYPLAGFITDDQGARKMAERVVQGDRVRTTPMVLGWLFYHSYLNGSDIDLITSEHKLAMKSDKGDLTKFFYQKYNWAIQRKLMDQGTSG